MNKNYLSVVFAFLVVLGSADVRAADDLGALMQEVNQLSSDRKAIVEKMQSNLRVQQENEEIAKKLKADDDANKALDASLASRKPTVDRLCIRTVPKEQLAAANAECDRVLIPYNKDVGTLKERVKTVSEGAARLVASEKQRVAEAKELAARGEKIDAQLTAVRDRISLVLKANANECASKCARSSHVEVGAYCLSKCWDGATPGLSAVEKTEQYQRQFGTRTFEQAIDEYKKSGPAYIGKHYKPIDVPPPPK